jgi:hypothetical protein
MTNKETSEPRYLEHSLRRGAAIYWMDQYLVVEGWDLKDLTISVRNFFTGEVSMLSYTNLITLPSSAKKPIFANNIDELLAKMKNGEHDKENPACISEDGIRPTYLEKGRHVIKMIETVRQAKKAAHDKAGDRRINELGIIEDCIKRLPRPNSLTTFYDYEHRYDMNDGDLARIARSFQTKRYGKTRQSPALIHLFELLLERFHFDPDGFVLEISTIINKLRKILKRSNNLWVDSKVQWCDSGDLVENCGYRCSLT